MDEDLYRVNPLILLLSQFTFDNNVHSIVNMFLIFTRNLDIMI